MAVDLHIHSTASDGTLTPKQIVAIAAEKGLNAIAIADHDTIEGVPAAMQAATDRDPDLFAAVELSATHSGGDVHILGYMVEPTCRALSQALQEIQESRRRRIRIMVEKLQQLGVGIELDDVSRLSKGGSPGRPHVARALVQCGAAASQKHAFRRYLRHGRPAYVDRHRVAALEAINIIHESNGLAVLAHPGLGCPDSTLQNLADAGLDGVEAYHVDHSRGQINKYREMAPNLDLMITGGTDSHGPEGPSPVEIGAVNVPDECARQLRRWGQAHGRWPPDLQAWQRHKKRG